MKLINDKQKQFLGSSYAFILGLLILIAGAGKDNMFIAGWSMILGSLAYKSAKERRLGPVKDATLRKIFELIGIAIILFLLIITDRNSIIEDPFPFLVVPIWAIIAYFIAFSKSK